MKTRRVQLAIASALILSGCSADDLQTFSTALQQSGMGQPSGFSQDSISNTTCRSQLTNSQMALNDAQASGNPQNIARAQNMLLMTQQGC